jgi:hypothetical protein
MQKKTLFAINNFVTRAADATGPRSRIATNTPPLDDTELSDLAHKLEADAANEECPRKRAELIERADIVLALMQVRQRTHCRHEAARIATNDDIGRPILTGFEGEAVLD